MCAARRHQWSSRAGYGLGGVLGAATISAGSRWAYLLLAAVNAASYLLAATLVLHWKPAAVSDPPMSRPDLPPARHKVEHGTYRHLLRDRALALVTGMNLAFVLCGSVLTVLLAVYLTNVLGLPVWLAGALFTVNTVLVVALQTVITRHIRRYRQGRVLQAAALCWIAAFLMFWALTVTPHPLLAAVLLAAIPRGGMALDRADRSMHTLHHCHPRRAPSGRSAGRPPASAMTSSPASAASRSWPKALRQPVELFEPTIREASLARLARGRLLKRQAASCRPSCGRVSCAK